MRKTIIPLATMALWLPNPVFALALGELQVQSALNEPLAATIAIRSATEQEIADLSVSVANQEAFDTVGVPRPFILNDLRFEVVPDAGTPYVQIVSRQPINEPFLDVLVEADWKDSRVVRQYAVLLDPPLYQPPSVRPTAERVRAGDAGDAGRADGTSDDRPAPSMGERYGPTRSNDTLWEIAEDIQADRYPDASVYQVMMALYRENPNAFFEANVNNLRRGVELQIPDRATVTQQSSTSARRSFNQQYDTWLAERGQAQPRQQVAGTADGQQGGDQGAGEPRLEIVSPQGERETQGETTAAASNAQVEQLQRQLALTEESQEALRAENDDMQGRLSELEAQLDRIATLLELRNEEIDTLQRELAEANERLDTQAQQASAPQQSGQTEAASAEGGAMSALTNSAVLGAAALFVVLLGVIMFLVLRLQQRREELEAVTFEGAAAPASPTTPVARTASPERTAPSEPTMPVAPAEDRSFADEMEIPEEPALAEESPDPVAEADTLMSYGLHRQAADLLEGELENDPTRLPYRFKLLEVLHAGGDVEGFNAQAQQTQSRLTPGFEDQWQHVLSLGQRLDPKNPMYVGADATVARPAEWTGSNVEDETLDEQRDASSDEDVNLKDLEFEEVDLQELGIGPAAETDDQGTSERTPVPQERGASDDLSLDFDAQGEDDDTVAEPFSEPESLDLDVDLESPPESAPAPLRTSEDTSAESFDLPAAPEEDLSTVQTAPSARSGASETESLDLDFDSSDEPSLDEFDSDDFDLESDIDEVSTKLDLAKVFLDMGDEQGAKSTLEEVIKEGDDKQRAEAERLMKRL